MKSCGRYEEFPLTVVAGPQKSRRRDELGIRQLESLSGHLHKVRLIFANVVLIWSNADLGLVTDGADWLAST